MLKLIKPQRLKPGDTVATVSLSWGGAGDEDLVWRYNLGKERLEKQFGLKVREMPNTLKGSRFIYDHPEERAKDLMDAFTEPDIKAIFSCIGGDESVRMLPYIDFDVIRNNPKVFMGYSDTTITHYICLKAGISSFYGPSILAEFAENNGMFHYTAEWIKQVLFSSETIGSIPAASEWTGDRVEWTEANKHVTKTMCKNQGYDVIQGSGIVRGQLIGGCIEVMEMMKGTDLWPQAEAFDGAILFFETSEDMPEPTYLEYWLRNYGSQGILMHIKGMMFGKPYQSKYYDEYKSAITKVLAEINLDHLPVFCNMTYGHNEPMCILPYGAEAELNCDTAEFSIIESGVL